MTKTETNNTAVYDRACEHVIGWVNSRATSIGAAKAVGAKRCAFRKIAGVWSWHVTKCGNRCCRLGKNLETVWGDDYRKTCRSP